MYLEPDATLSCDGRGAASKGSGSGKDGASGGSGAGHGTPGGDGKAVGGGSEFGSLYQPTSLGARGGDGPTGILGSRGGGRMRVKVGYAFILDGVMRADGDNAPANSGWCYVTM